MIGVHSPKCDHRVVPAVKIGDLTERRFLAFDLADVLEALAPIDGALEWLVDDTELMLAGDADGALTEAELDRMNALDGQMISTDELVTLAPKIRQTIWGTFTAYLPGVADASLCIKAIDSSFWLVWAPSPEPLRGLSARFRDVTDHDEPAPDPR